MNSMQRVLTTLNHEEPDRVPLFLLLTMHGAAKMGMSIKEYFSKGDYVAEGQLRLLETYQHDCLYLFFYASLEVEAAGGEVLYAENGPPNAGRSILSSLSDIDRLTPPDVYETPCLQKVLKAIELLKQEVNDTVPIVGVVMSPFSLPVMQMGFANYIELMYDQEKHFHILMEKNRQFAVSWANAQLRAGATAICYFDPVSSPLIVPREKYLQTGYVLARETISAIEGPTAIHLASGISLPIADDLARTGTAIIGVSAEEDLADLKAAYSKKLTIIGNLNGLTMRHWDRTAVEREVKTAIDKAAPGGGFILADNHGEIPLQVPESTLKLIAETVRTYGKYPVCSNEND